MNLEKRQYRKVVFFSVLHEKEKKIIRKTKVLLITIKIVFLPKFDFVYHRYISF